ncbi:hypothetical protein SK128_017079, partial [Halocaridina rubra]
MPENVTPEGADDPICQASDVPDSVVPVAVVASRSSRARKSNNVSQDAGSVGRDRYDTVNISSSRTTRDRYVVGLVTPRRIHDQNEFSDTRTLLADEFLVDPESGGDVFASCRLESTCDEEEGAVGISWGKAMFLIINAALGAGLLNFPRAFHEAGGIVAGNIVHVIFTTFALGSLVIIGRCASERNCKTYQELVLHMCSPGWSIMASIFIAIYCFITCITFIIIIGDQFDRVFASYVGRTFCHHWYLNRKFTMVISSLLLVFPSCFKRIDGLRFMSYVGVLSIWYLVAVIVEEYYNGHYPKGPVVIFDIQCWTQIFDVVPTICFGYQCHVSSVPIYSCLKHQDAKTFMKACVSAVSVCLAVYTLSANYGYLTFGSRVEGDVLLSYDPRRIQVFVAVILLGIKSWTTYPILLFCVREAVSDMYIRLKSISPVEAAVNEPIRRKVIAVVLWAASIIMAVFTPNINVVVEVLGSLAAFFIFVFP